MNRTRTTIYYLLIVAVSLIIATALAGIWKFSAPLMLMKQNEYSRRGLREQQKNEQCQSLPPSRMTTPDLIACAFSNGDISQDQRILYLTYAVGEYEKLPAAFNSDISWDGEPILRELEGIATSASSFCTLPPKTQAEMRKRFPQATSCQTNEDTPISGIPLP